MDREAKIAKKIVADSGDVDWSFNPVTFFIPVEDQRQFTRKQMEVGTAVLAKALDWSGGDMIRMIRGNIKGHAGLMNILEEAGLRLR